MWIQIVTLLAIFFMVIIIRRMFYNDIILKKILLEDNMDINLNKPLTIKQYRKLYKNDFEPYLMRKNSDINKDIFENFMITYDMRSLDFIYKQPDAFHIVFINNIEGYVHNKEDDSYDIILKKDFIPFSTKNKKDIEIIDTLMNLKYNIIEEFNTNGIIKINKKYHFLTDLTSISSYKTAINNKEFSVLVFNFGNVTETLVFKTFEESFRYLFMNEKSDIRLIQKIANESIIKDEGGE